MVGVVEDLGADAGAGGRKPAVWSLMSGEKGLPGDVPTYHMSDNLGCEDDEYYQKDVLSDEGSYFNDAELEQKGNDELLALLSQMADAPTNGGELPAIENHAFESASHIRSTFAGVDMEDVDHGLLEAEVRRLQQEHAALLAEVRATVEKKQELQARLQNEYNELAHKAGLHSNVTESTVSQRLRDVVERAQAQHMEIERDKMELNETIREEWTRMYHVSQDLGGKRMEGEARLEMVGRAITELTMEHARLVGELKLSSERATELQKELQCERDSSQRQHSDVMAAIATSAQRNANFRAQATDSGRASPSVFEGQSDRGSVDGAAYTDDASASSATISADRASWLRTRAAGSAEQAQLERECKRQEHLIAEASKELALEEAAWRQLQSQQIEADQHVADAEHDLRRAAASGRHLEVIRDGQQSQTMTPTGSTASGDGQPQRVKSGGSSVESGGLVACGDSVSIWAGLDVAAQVRQAETCKRTLEETLADHGSTAQAAAAVRKQCVEEGTNLEEALRSEAAGKNEIRSLREELARLHDPGREAEVREHLLRLDEPVADLRAHQVHLENALAKVRNEITTISSNQDSLRRYGHGGWCLKRRQPEQEPSALDRGAPPVKPPPRALAQGPASGERPGAPRAVASTADRPPVSRRPEQASGSERGGAEPSSDAAKVPPATAQLFADARNLCDDAQQELSNGRGNERTRAAAEVDLEAQRPAEAPAPRRQAASRTRAAETSLAGPARAPPAGWVVRDAQGKAIAGPPLKADAPTAAPGPEAGSVWAPPPQATHPRFADEGAEQSAASAAGSQGPAATAPANSWPESDWI